MTTVKNFSNPDNDADISNATWDAVIESNQKAENSKDLITAYFKNIGFSVLKNEPNAQHMGIAGTYPSFKAEKNITLSEGKVVVCSIHYDIRYAKFYFSLAGSVSCKKYHNDELEDKTGYSLEGLSIKSFIGGISYNSFTAKQKELDNMNFIIDFIEHKIY
jgi:hypothetical protein